MSQEGEHRIFLERPLQQVRLLAVRERSKTIVPAPRRSSSSDTTAVEGASGRRETVSASSHSHPASTTPSASHSSEPAIGDARERPDAASAVLGEFLQNLQEQLAELESRRKASLAELQQLAIELAIAIAGHVLRAEVVAGNYPIESLVREAIDRLDGPQMATVHVHPDDLAWLQANGDITTKFTTVIRWIGDRELPRGSCLVEAADLGLMTRWSQQLDDIHRRLLEGLENAQIERRGSRETPEGMRRFPERRETA